ncbi:MAG: hypothetical protein AB8G96_06785 [Phycisphaerales bacterium]
MALLVAAGLLNGGCLRGPLGSTTAEARLTRGGTWTIVPDVAIPEPPGPAGCGAQALAAVLVGGVRPLDRPRVASDLAAELPWHNHGATPVDLLLEARRRGATARIAAGTWDELREAVSRGEPPLVMLDAGLEVRTLSATVPLPAVMHWAVVTGMRDDGERVAIGAPNGRHHTVKRSWFESRWDASDRCVIHITPAGHASGQEPAPEASPASAESALQPAHP